jgi:CRISPR-associated protein Cas2
MLIVSYDISNNKTRFRFSKFLEKYGRRLQYSVFELKNSSRILSIVLLEIEKKFQKKFENSDSILIFSLCE